MMQTQWLEDFIALGATGSFTRAADPRDVTDSGIGRRIRGLELPRPVHRPLFALAPPDLGRWRSGNTGTAGVWRFDSGRPGRRLMISALMHGNELCGAWTLVGLLHAGVRPAAGSLTLAFGNLEAFDRFHPAVPDASRFVDEDLNRQWAAARIAAADTRERRRAAELRPHVDDADWLLDLHSMHEPGEPLGLTGLRERHVELARRLGAPVHLVADAGHQDGVRLRDYDRFGVPDDEAPDARSLLLECGHHGDPASVVVARDLTARMLDASGVLDAADVAARLPGWRQPDRGPRWLLRVTEPVIARSPHFHFHETYRSLAVIPHAGTVIGDNDGEPVATPYDDCVLVMPSARQAQRGVTVVRYARRERLD